MALSASNNFAMTATQIVTEALQKIGVTAVGANATGDDLVKGIRNLNLFLQQLQGEGLQFVLRRRQSITLTASDYDYILAPSGGDVTMPNPEEILQVDLKNTSTSEFESNLTEMSYTEYFSLPSRLTDTGTPTHYYLDRTSITTSTLYIWPIPTSTDASTYTLQLSYRKPIDDIDSPSDSVECHPRWYLAIIFGLAELLAVDAGLSLPEQQNLERKAKRFKDAAMSSDAEGSVRFVPRRRQ